MNYKIVVVGIGGVGGYFGGLLAKKYALNPDYEIIFLARGDNYEQIQNNGLTIIDGVNTFNVKPDSVVDDVSKIGIANLILVCTKSYDLQDVLHLLKTIVDNSTIILPLLNGVKNSIFIKENIPNAVVLQGCTYIISKLKSPGVIENSGAIQKIYFGNTFMTNEIEQVNSIFANAGIEVTVSNEIEKIIWEKFVFVSTVATITSYYNNCVGLILKTEEETIKELIFEVSQLAFKIGIELESNIISKTLDKIKLLPFETTSSMQKDFEKKNSKTEIETLTGFIVHESKKMNLKTPNFKKMYKKLKI